LVVRGRPCVPTEYGQFLCHHVEQVQLLEHDLNKSLGTLDDHKAGSPATIRIAVNRGSLATWFPEVIDRASHELNLQFDIVPDDQDHTALQLRNGEVLAAITTESRPLHGCHRRPLGALSYLAVATPDYMDKTFEGKPSLTKMAEAPALIFDRKDMLPQQWLMNAFGSSVALRGHWLPSYSGYLSCCLNGSGWGLMPPMTVNSYLETGELVELVPGSEVSIGLHWQASTRGSEIMRRLTRIVGSVSRKYLTIDDQFIV